MPFTQEEIKNLETLLQSPVEENVKLAFAIMGNDLPIYIKVLLEEYKDLYEKSHLNPGTGRRSEVLTDIEAICLAINQEESVVLDKAPKNISLLKSVKELFIRYDDFSKEDFFSWEKLNMIESLKFWRKELKKSTEKTLWEQFKQITDISLYDIEHLPNIFSNLDNLALLTITPSNLSKEDFSILENMPSLKKVKIWWHTLYKDLPMTFWEQFQQIKKLELYNHNIAQLPDVIPYLYQLESLNLKGNRKIAEIDFSPLISLKFFKSLMLSECYLSNLPSNLSKLKDLKELYLSNNNFETADLSILTSLKKLEKLNLESCKLQHLPTELSELLNLKELILYKNHFDEADFSILQSIKTLKYLNLRNCKLTDIPEAISQLPNLEKLDLAYNDLSKADFSILANLKHLKKLDITSCKLTEIPAVLSKLPQLKCKI